MAEIIAPTAPPTQASTDQWTYERYLRETAEGEYFAIIEGEKVVSPSPVDIHQVVAGNLYGTLWVWLRQNPIGKIRDAPYDVVLDQRAVVQPDLLIVLNEHRSRLTRRNLQGAPDLVVEVLSPSSLRLDRVVKRALYARYGVPEYWIVSPEERTVEVLHLQGDHYDTAALWQTGDTLTSPTLPGFACAVDDLFLD